MNINLNEILALLLVFVPFILVGIGAILSANTGFFQTEVIKQLNPKERFYLDKLFGNKSPLILQITLVLFIAYAIYASIQLQDIFIVITIWLSFICLRWTHKFFMQLQAFSWEEYANHKDKYNPDTNKYDKYPNKFRITYPTPDISEEILKSEPCCARDSEMIFNYKLVHGIYADKVNSWVEFRNKIKSKKSWRIKRDLLLKTSLKLADNKTTEEWQQQWQIPDLNPDKIWKDLKSAQNFNDFAQKWHFYAILISRGTIGKFNKWIFHPLVHIVLIAGIGYAYYCIIENSSFNMQLGANMVLSSVLFGISVLFSVIYSVMALMLFIYGKVISIDDFNLPMPKLGEPFFVETSRVAVTLSISTAITVGLGIPLTLTLNFSSSTSIIGAVLAGLITAFIFVLSVWGTHFSMDNTKSKVLERLFNQIVTEKDATNLEALKIKYAEVNAVPIWPVNFVVYINIIAALIFPIILEKIFDGITL